MFRIVHEQKLLDGAVSLGHNVTEVNDIRDLSDILLGLGFSVSDANRFQAIAANMRHEDIFENRNVVIVCFDETKGE